MKKRFLFFATGITATIWFLIRVIPKPSRASYPCMRRAAPVMSGFVVYLLSLGGFAVFIRKARQNFLRARYFAAASMLFAALITGAFFMGHSTVTSHARGMSTGGPGDGPNQPIGVGNGVHPGRVVWAWNPRATNADCVNIYELFKPGNTNQGVVNRMVVDGVQNLGGKTTLSESWDVIFRSFNYKKSKIGKGYTPGEKFFIKINQGTANGRVRNPDHKEAFNVPLRFTKSKQAREGKMGACETYPSVALEILRELVYVDRSTANTGRTLIHPTENDLVYYSDNSQSDKLYDIIEKDGLTSNNILCISVDRDGVVWLGTNSGVTSYNQGEFTKYQNKD